MYRFWSIYLNICVNCITLLLVTPSPFIPFRFTWTTDCHWIFVQHHLQVLFLWKISFCENFFWMFRLIEYISSFLPTLLTVLLLSFIRVCADKFSRISFVNYCRMKDSVLCALYVWMNCCSELAWSQQDTSWAVCWCERNSAAEAEIFLLRPERRRSRPSPA